MDRLIRIFKKMDIEQAELFATVHAVWNDFLIDKTEPSAADIIADVYAWDKKKKKFTQEQIISCIQWMKKEDFISLGIGQKTLKST